MLVAILCAISLTTSPLPDFIVETHNPTPNHNCTVKDIFHPDHNLLSLMSEFKRMEVLAVELAHAINCSKIASKDDMLGLLDDLMNDGDNSAAELFQADVRMASIVEQ